MSTNQNKNEEEVDLGSLFVIIGKGFSKFFNFIGNIFKGIFHFLITILLFLKQHFLKITIVAIVGGVLGAFLEFQKDKTFGSDLFVQPNFKSSRQLYNNINYYNDLVKQKDTILLAKTFNISNNQASSLKKFEVSAIISENDIISSYDDLILSVDTTTVKSYSFDKFKNMFTKYDYKIHQVHVEASQNTVFSKLDGIIISAIIENDYYKKRKDLNNEYLNRTDNMLRKDLTYVDSLHQVYKKVLVEEAKKSTSGTSINTGTNNQKAKELELFSTNRRINEDLKDITEDRSEKSEVINIISNFQPVGYEVKGVTKNYVFILAALGAGFMVFVLLFMKLNTYLSNYKK